jgi:drug/metabolite transporter (DMT)-like permease
MVQPRARLLLPLALSTAVLAISTSSIMIRFAQADAPSLVIAGVRLAFATLLLSPIALTRYRSELQGFRRKEIALGALAGLFLAVHFATWTSSLEYTSVASSVVFVSTGPLWVAILSPLLLDERLTSAAVVGLLIAIAGGMLIGLADACTWGSKLRCPEFGHILQGRAMWGNFLALAGAWTVSGYLIIGRKLRTARNLSLIPYILLVYGTAAIALLGILFAAGQTPFGYPARAYGWIFLLAAFPQLMGHSTYNWALRYVPATLVAVITLVEPIASAVLAYFILRETPALGVVAGGLLILVGIFLASRRQ